MSHPSPALSQVSGERMLHDFHTFNLKVGLSEDMIHLFLWLFILLY